MTKIFLTAMSTLPKRFVADGTDAIQWCDDTVFAIHPKYQPIVWKKETGKWTRYVPKMSSFHNGRLYFGSQLREEPKKT